MKIILYIVVILLSVIGLSFWFITIPIEIFIHLLVSRKNTDIITDTKISKVKFYSGIAIAILCGICFYKPFTDHMQIISIIGFPIGSWLILGLKLPDNQKTNEQLDELSKKLCFGAWDISIHCHEGQLSRFERSLYDTIRVQKLDEYSKSALIVGTTGNIYNVTLDSCTCPDFQTRHLPCKHIYFLARKLNVFNLNFDFKRVIEYQKSKVQSDTSNANTQ